MSDIKIGAAVVEQAQDKSFWNTEPAVAKAVVVGGATSVLVAAGAFGLVSEEQRVTIIEQVGNITYGAFVIAPILISVGTALWSRLSTFSPRTAARIAVINAKSTNGTPTLITPP